MLLCYICYIYLNYHLHILKWFWFSINEINNILSPADSQKVSWIWNVPSNDMKIIKIDLILRSPEVKKRIKEFGSHATWLSVLRKWLITGSRYTFHQLWKLDVGIVVNKKVRIVMLFHVVYRYLIRIEVKKIEWYYEMTFELMNVT